MDLVLVPEGSTCPMRMCGLCIAQAMEFLKLEGARVLAGYPAQGASGANDWQPVIWRGLGVDYDALLHAGEARAEPLHDQLFIFRKRLINTLIIH